MEGEGPAADAGEEVAVDEAFEVVGGDIEDGAGIDFTFGNQVGGYEIAEPLRGVGAVFVVVVHTTLQRRFAIST